LKENVAEFTARPRRATRLKFLIGFTVAASFPFYAAIAGPLDLDTTFSNDGKVVTNFQLDPQDARGLGPFICLYVETCGKTKVSFGGGYPVALALRKADGTQDGKIVVAGKFGLARFNADGTFDDTFGNAGIVDSQNNLAYAVAIEANGMMIITMPPMCTVPLKSVFVEPQDESGWVSG